MYTYAVVSALTMSTLCTPTSRIWTAVVIVNQPVKAPTGRHRMVLMKTLLRESRSVIRSFPEAQDHHFHKTCQR